MDPHGPHREVAELQAAADRLVTVAAYVQPIEAHLARARLETEGIQAFLADEHIIGVQWLYAMAVGGVKVQVRRWQRDAALSVLASCDRSVSHDFVSGDLNAPRCPRCGSLRVEAARFSRPLRLASWLLLGIPLLFLRRTVRCGSCAKHWSLREDHTS